MIVRTTWTVFNGPYILQLDTGGNRPISEDQAEQCARTGNQCEVTPLPTTVSQYWLLTCNASPNPGRWKMSVSKIIKTYDYRDENNTLLYQAVRYEPKDFRPSPE